MVHVLLLAFSLVCFLFAAWQSASPQWNRIVSVGLAALAASMIQW